MLVVAYYPNCCLVDKWRKIILFYPKMIYAQLLQTFSRKSRQLLWNCQTKYKIVLVQNIIGEQDRTNKSCFPTFEKTGLSSLYSHHWQNRENMNPIKHQNVSVLVHSTGSYTDTQTQTNLKKEEIKNVAISTFCITVLGEFNPHCTQTFFRRLFLR